VDIVGVEEVRVRRKGLIASFRDWSRRGEARRSIVSKRWVGKAALKEPLRGKDVLGG
jgi:hypothetical protein